jgi:hypothetical protein
MWRPRPGFFDVDERLKRLQKPSAVIKDDPCAFDDLLWIVSIGNQLLQLQSSLPLEHKLRFVMFHPQRESPLHKGFKCS